MANIVENTFESITNKLSPMPPPQWDQDQNIRAYNEIDPGSTGYIEHDDDMVSTIADDETLDRVTGRLGGEDVLSADERSALGGGVRHRGTEALAFYKSWRFIDRRPFRGRWGIFYIKSGISYIESLLDEEYPGRSSTRSLARQFLFEHEHFHYVADLQTLFFEANYLTQRYEPLRQVLRGKFSIQFAEEALANRRVWEWSKKPSVGIREFAYDFMKLQPGAYARFDERKLTLASEWLWTAIECFEPGTVFPDDARAPWVHAVPDDLMRRTLCPEWVVRPSTLTTWLPQQFNLPPVERVDDGPEIAKALGGKYSSLKETWAETKAKILSNHHRPGLDFKRWPAEGPSAFSVRVGLKFRAHMRHITRGVWEAYAIGSHKEMGHG